MTNIVKNIKNEFVSIVDHKKRKGNAISEIDNYYKLQRNNPKAAKDRLRGHFGDKDGNWEQAEIKAQTVVELFNDIGEGKIDFKSAYKAEKDLQKENKSKDKAINPFPLLT